MRASTRRKWEQTERGEFISCNTLNQIKMPKCSLPFTKGFAEFTLTAVLWSPHSLNLDTRKTSYILTHNWKANYPVVGSMCNQTNLCHRHTDLADLWAHIEVKCAHLSHTERRAIHKGYSTSALDGECKNIIGKKTIHNLLQYPAMWRNDIVAFAMAFNHTWGVLNKWCNWKCHT